MKQDLPVAAGPCEPLPARGKGPRGRGCARRMRGRGAAAPAEPHREREVSGARRLRAALGPGEGRDHGPVSGDVAEGGGNALQKTDFFFSLEAGAAKADGAGGLLGRGGSRAQAWRGIFPAMGISAIFASKTFLGALRWRLEHWSILKRLA